MLEGFDSLLASKESLEWLSLEYAKIDPLICKRDLLICKRDVLIWQKRPA